MLVHDQTEDTDGDSALYMARLPSTRLMTAPCTMRENVRRWRAKMSAFPAPEYRSDLSLMAGEGKITAGSRPSFEMTKSWLPINIEPTLRADYARALGE